MVVSDLSMQVGPWHGLHRITNSRRLQTHTQPSMSELVQQEREHCALAETLHVSSREIAHEGSWQKTLNMYIFSV